MHPGTPTAEERPEVLYEAKLAQHGRRLFQALLLVFVLWAGFVSAILFLDESFGTREPVIAFTVVGAIMVAVPIVMACRWCRNPGIYRVSVDHYGIYVHSDDASSGKAFSVVATDLHSLVRITCKHHENSDTYEYYVQTKSGPRYQLADVFADFDHNALF